MAMEEEVKEDKGPAARNGYKQYKNGQGNITNNLFSPLRNEEVIIKDIYGLPGLLKSMSEEKQIHCK